ncbi:MAG: hypothetical protein ACREQV_05215, partial [Candidatus Binatia bacterium]
TGIRRYAYMDEGVEKFAIGYGIQFRFTVGPAPDFANLQREDQEYAEYWLRSVEWDVTRRIVASRNWFLDSDGNVLDSDTLIPTAHPDEPDDDAGANLDGDETRSPPGPGFNYMFSFDAPGPKPETNSNPGLVTDIVWRINFEEYLRVNVNGKRPDESGLNADATNPSWSRASGKQEWHARFHVVDQNGVFVPSTGYQNEAENENEVGVGRITIGDQP